MQRFGEQNLRKAVAQAGLAGVCLLTSWGVLAASFGAPILESALGERLRVVLPLTGTANDRISLDCVKLRESATETGDISRLVRAELFERRSGQAILLTTSQPVNDLVVSFEVGIGCGSWFSRRYTFLLDLPRERPVAAADAPIAPPTVDVARPDIKAEAAPVRKPARRSDRGERTGERSGERTEGRAGANQAKGAAAPPSIMRVVRPEDEPGVLPRTRPGARAAAAKPLGVSGARSLLKIEMGGIDQLLAGVARSPIEEATGMRLSAEIGAVTAGRSAQTDRVEFKLAHARFLAAMRDQPDPVTTENTALSKRLDGLAKDLSSLKVDLQKSTARTRELESSHVAWWWLVVAALVAAAAGAALAFLARRSAPERLILLDPVPKPRAQQDVVKTAGDDDREELFGTGSTIAEKGGTAQSQTTLEANDLPSPPATKAAAYDATIRVDSSRLTASDAPARGESLPIAPDQPVAAPAPAPAPFVLDKNSLTQQLATMSDLSDESWASYRHSSDTSGVALPFSSAHAAPATTEQPPPAPAVATDVMPDIHFDLSEDLAEHAEQKGGNALPALEFDPASAAHGNEAQATASQSVVAPFALETLDLPAALADAAHGLPPVFSSESSAPSSGQAVVMHSIMATASSIMETAWRQWETNSAAQAMKTIATYVQSAPAKAPPGPWIMLAHILHDVGMKKEYTALQDLFLERFGGSLPSWEDAYSLRKQQLGLARAPGIEILVANKRGQPELIGSLAGVAYRTDVPPAVLFDLTFQREVLQLAAECRPGFTQAESDVDLSL